MYFCCFRLQSSTSPKAAIVSHHDKFAEVMLPRGIGSSYLLRPKEQALPPAPRTLTVDAANSRSAPTPHTQLMYTQHRSTLARSRTGWLWCLPRVPRSQNGVSFETTGVESAAPRCSRGSTCSLTPPVARRCLGCGSQLRARGRRLAWSLPLGIHPPKGHFCPTCRGGHPQPLLRPAQS